MKGTTMTIGLLCMAAAEPAVAQIKTGSTIGTFMMIEPSARITAMGNAGVSIDDPIQAVYYNAAALGSLTQPFVQFTHCFWFSDIAVDYIAVAVPAGSFGNLMGSAAILRSGDIDVRTVSQPLGTGEKYGVTDVGLSLGYAREITDRFGAGIQVHYLDETIWHSTMRTFTFSVGTLYRLSDSGIRLGASLANFGTGGHFDGRDLAIQYDNDPDRYGDNSALPGAQSTGDFPVPILFRVGMCFPQRLSNATRVLVVVDAQHPSDNAESLNAGWETIWKESFAVRVGYQTLLQTDSTQGITAGVGVRGSMRETKFQCDYAWAYHEVLTATHRLTLVLGF
jgi:hypothetical protein